jgi:hypothetical protein
MSGSHKEIVKSDAIKLTKQNKAKKCKNWLKRKMSEAISLFLYSSIFQIIILLILCFSRILRDRFYNIYINELKI